MVNIQIEGWVLMVLLVAYGGYAGWKRGIRAFLTVAIVSSLAYLALVSGGEQILGYANTIYARLPKIFALLTGGDPGQVANLSPLEIPWEIPAIVRGALYLVLVLLAWFYNKNPTWYLERPGDTLQRQLGSYSGVTTAFTWVSAATELWNESTLGTVNPDGILNGIFVNMPDVTSIVPVLIMVLFVIIVASIVLKVPNLLKPPPPPKK